MAILSTSDAYQGVYTKIKQQRIIQEGNESEKKSWKTIRCWGLFQSIEYALIKSMAVDLALDGDSGEWWI